MKRIQLFFLHWIARDLRTCEPEPKSFKDFNQERADLAHELAIPPTLRGPLRGQRVW